jgi:DNA-binding MarR family transcriptional regulator
MTDRQRQVLAFVRRHNGTTFRAVAAHLGVSPYAAVEHLEALRLQGLVTWEPNQSRTIRAVKSSYVLPFAGKVPGVKSARELEIIG